ncbi:MULTISPECIES: sugar ABC transporter substrate-binding protein [Pasteurellaceae]|uniref:Sugar ABC transporter substrate-binding protein n=1 Tax=Pasteurella atlantica TaxID=2827233 RepID=A0AAW8CPY1_9PAST|nr:sugar ABC transporter substrate-binding protein [Pasteurella atlantica]MBR0573483.1 sugar ABC transporter substrate-binding protein [Pasteurella atlantica]MDP8039484.1 sugar ABC transporter substrate-binding protein [Pasteurella atlantica]MDP8041575.1 sugar ABC transporter substrate-binding protein [Pasteurella atlantica]MDP8043712.1 sugar ABC transporter substrate-binding protein [Pasteurella atlantica]MDP8045791.1 sugar ABC transporter substrate-binding protein [Pasteurella atlantica]
MFKKSLILGLGIYCFSLMVQAKELVIGVSMYSLSDKYPTYLQDAMKRFDKEHNDVRFKYADANSDPARMLNDIENFIDSGVDALLVMPTDKNIVKAVGLKAKKAKLPLVIVNGKPKEKDMKYVTSFIGSEEITAGEMQSEFILKQLNGKAAKAIILMGPLGWEAQIQRTEGNQKVLKPHSEIKIITKQEAKWDRAKAMDITENLLAAHKDINVIFSNNDEMAIGALLAARKMGLKDEDLLIVGIDATPDALAYLGKGLDATVYQSAAGQGSLSAEIAYKAAKGEKVAQYNWIPFELVTPEKKEKYLHKYKE